MIGLALSLALAATAQQSDRTAGFSPAYQACVARDASNAALSHCQIAELELQTATLNGLVTSYASRMDLDQARLMHNLKQGWVVALETRCGAEASELEGAAYGRAYTECRIAGLVALTSQFSLSGAN